MPSLFGYTQHGELMWCVSVGFCEILARKYAPGAAAPGTAAPGAAVPGAWIIWCNILSSICSRSFTWMYTAPGAYLNMLLEHCAF